MTEGSPDKPITVTIDFGGDALRVATDRAGTPTVMDNGSYPIKLGRTIRFQSRQNEGEAGWRVLSLKRILDSDDVVRSEIARSSADMTAMEYVTHLFRSVRQDPQVSGNDRPLQALGAIPPCFSQRQRSALRNALTAAGFTRAKLVDDSLAALLASWDQLQRRNSILVYSWGASTFCASLYRPTGTGFRAAIAPEGDCQLGGDDVDSALLNYLDQALSKKWHVDFRDRDREQAVFTELERVKLALAGGQPGIVSLPALGINRDNAPPGEDLIEIPRGVFDEVIAPMLSKTLELVDKVLSGGGCEKPDAVLLVGEMALSANVQSILEDRFPGRLVRAGENAVVLGAGIHGRMLPAQEWEDAEKRQEGQRRPTNPQPQAPPEPVRQKPMAARQPEENGARSWAATLDLAPLLDRAEAFDRAGMLTEAVEVLESAQESLGKLSGIVYGKAAADYIARGKPELALPLLRRANQFAPTMQQIALKYVELCLIQCDLHKKKDLYREALGFAYEARCAIDKLPDAVREKSRYLANCLHWEASVFIALGRFMEAEKLLERCVQLDPKEECYLADLEAIRQSFKKTTLKSWVQGVANGLRKPGRNDSPSGGNGGKSKKSHRR